MKEIILSGGQVCLVDDADYSDLSVHKWRSTGRYAVRTDENNKMIRMHREIMRPPGELEVDHINRNSFDNRRENLRVCTRSQNQRNQPPTAKNRTGYKGVSIRADKIRNKFCVHISIGKKRKCLGCFPTPESAALIYDKFAKEIFGEFAFLNFPEREPGG